MRGKRYKGISDLIEKDKLYEAKEAISLAKRTASAGFDETVELHLRTGVDPRQADQQIRGVTVLPGGTGKTVRIVVFAQGEAAKIAEDAGAEFVGSDELISKIQGGWTEFDIAIATPDMMSSVGKLGRVLGRKGLMPNPKSGTVVNQDRISSAISDAKKGRVEYRLDKLGIVHVAIGKASFKEDNLLENFVAVVESIARAKPNGLKGDYVKSIYLTTTMGPGIPLEVTSTMAMTADSI